MELNDKEWEIIEPLLPELPSGKRGRPEDDMIISCAVATSAEYIVSRDRDLLDLGNYRQIQIVTPEDFMRITKVRYPRQSLT